LRRGCAARAAARGRDDLARDQTVAQWPPVGFDARGCSAGMTPLGRARFAPVSDHPRLGRSGAPRPAPAAALPREGHGRGDDVKPTDSLGRDARLVAGGRA